MHHKLRVYRTLLLVSACWASMNSELGLPLDSRLRCLDSITIVWSFVILCTSSMKFLAKDISLNITRGANFRDSAYRSTNVEPRLDDLLTINYLPRINEFEKLYYGLVCASIGTSLFWRLYLKFYRVEFTSCKLNDAKRGLMRFFYRGPPIVAAAADAPAPAAAARSAAKTSSEPVLKSREEIETGNATLSNHRLEKGDNLEWIKLFECRAVIKDVAGCSEELVRSLRLDSRNLLPARRMNVLSTLHGKLKRKLIESKKGQSKRREPTISADQNKEEHDIFLNPVRNFNFLRDNTWNRWNYIAHNLGYILAFIALLTMPLLYFTILGLYSVMLNFSYEKLDSNIKLSLYCYGVMEQVYACTQAALFFVFTNIFITIFHADIVFKISTIERDLRGINLVVHQWENQGRAAEVAGHQLVSLRPPKILIYYQQLRLWAFFDYVGQVDDFVSKYSVVAMSTLIIGLSFGQSFLKVEEPALKTGTAAVMVSNFLSFSYLYVISWDIERRSSRLHETLLSIAAHECDFLIKRLWLKTLFGFFERDGKRTFTLANKYPLNLHSYFKTVFGWLTMSLLINRLFHKRTWESSFG